MARTLELLLIENVDGTGIVGDVVKVRKGFARNFLLPRSLATKPSAELIKQLAGKRADAQKMLAELRSQREAMTKRLSGIQLTLIRSCNDMGILYAAITQHDVATALGAAGYAGIKDREVRLAQTIKRIDHYDVHIKFEADLEAVIKLDVQPDRPLDLKKSSEASAPLEGAPADGAATPSEKRQKDRSAKGKKEDGAEGGTEEKTAPKGEFGAKSGAKPGEFGAKSSNKGDQPEKGPKADKADKGAKAEKTEKAEKKPAKK